MYIFRVLDVEVHADIRTDPRQDSINLPAPCAEARIVCSVGIVWATPHDVYGKKSVIIMSRQHGWSLAFLSLSLALKISTPASSLCVVTSQMMTRKLEYPHRVFLEPISRAGLRYRVSFNAVSGLGSPVSPALARFPVLLSVPCLLKNGQRAGSTSHLATSLCS